MTDLPLKTCIILSLREFADVVSLFKSTATRHLPQDECTDSFLKKVLEQESDFPFPLPLHSTPLVFSAPLPPKIQKMSIIITSESRDSECTVHHVITYLLYLRYSSRAVNQFGYLERVGLQAITNTLSACSLLNKKPFK